MNFLFRNTFSFIVILLLGGCSYQFGNVRRGLPGGYDKITIPIFNNPTSEPGVESYFTTALIEELQRSQDVRVTTGTDSQVIVDGIVTTIKVEQGALVDKKTSGFNKLPDDSSVMAKEYRMVVNVHLTLRRISDNSILWTGDFKGEQRFAAALVTQDPFNSVNPLYNHSARHLTLKVLAKTMMAEAHERMTENF